MTTVHRWVGVQVAMQSALGAAQTITAISKAATGVVTHSGTDPTAGDWILLTVQGMHQVNARVFRVATVDAGANTFQLEGENTTDYDTFSSGTFQVITFGTTFSTIIGLNGSGGDFDMIDTTTIHDLRKTQVPGPANPIGYTFDNLWDPADAGLTAMKVASDLQAQRAFRFTWPNGSKMAFTGYVGCTLVPTGNAGDKVSSPGVITMYGTPTFYTT